MPQEPQLCSLEAISCQRVEICSIVNPEARKGGLLRTCKGVIRCGENGIRFKGVIRCGENETKKKVSKARRDDGGWKERSEAATKLLL